MWSRRYWLTLRCCIDLLDYSPSNFCSAKARDSAWPESTRVPLPLQNDVIQHTRSFAVVAAQSDDPQTDGGFGTLRWGYGAAVHRYDRICNQVQQRDFMCAHAWILATVGGLYKMRP